jgi:hypothetical protein
MMDSFMVRYNHYSQSVIRSQQLGKEGGFVCDKNMGKTKIQWFVLCLVYHQIGINHLTLYTHTYIYTYIYNCNRFFPFFGGNYGLNVSAKPNEPLIKPPFTFSVRALA